MYRIYSALIEIVAAAVFIIPIWCIYNKLYFHSWKITILYMFFGFYLTAVLALVGFPNIMSLKVELTVNIIPFVYMIDDFVNACLNVLLFVPFGFLLPVLWKEFRNAKNIFIAGFAMTLFIEIAQIFSGRTTDINDIITNIAGTLIGYFIAYWFTGVFTRRMVKNSKKNDFYIMCTSVVFIMFFFQPFISSLLWEMVLKEIKLNVPVNNDTVWLNRNQLTELFEKDVKTIGKHIKNALKEELDDSVIAKFATTASDGKTYRVEHYNLDMIISVGYRVKSNRGGGVS